MHVKNEENYYTVCLNNTSWTLPKRYLNLTPLGRGAFGCVCAAEDVATGNKVAIKKLCRPFVCPMTAKRTYRELMLLKHMKHDNVLDLRDVVVPSTSVQHFDELYLVTTYMDGDLERILKGQRLSEAHIRLIIYSILRGLKYIHSAGIIHRDLKPANIAINENCDVRIIDLGLARPADNEMTGYVSTRWWRAPEIMLNWMHYTNKVDMWSVGCIMGEMYTGKPLFPGKDCIEQLTMTLKMVGRPDKDFLNKLQCEASKKFIKKVPKDEKMQFSKVFSNASPLAVDVLKRLLEINPDKRIDVDDALCHPFFKDYHDPEDEPCATPISWSESQDLSVDEWKTLTFMEAKSFDSSETGSNDVDME